MKNYALLLLTFLFSQVVCAQPNFSKYIAFPPDTLLGACNIVFESGALYLTSSAVSNATALNLYVAKFGTQGNLVWEKLLDPTPDAYYQLPGLQSSIWLDSALLISVDFFKSPENLQQGRVIALNENGGLLWKKDYGGTSFFSDGPLVKLNSQSAFRISYGSSDVNGDFWRIDKIDVAGDTIWSKNINAGGKYITSVDGAILSDNSVWFASGYQNDLADTEFGLIINSLSLDGDLTAQQTIYPLLFQSSGNLAANAAGSVLFYDLFRKIGNSPYPYWCLVNQPEGTTATEENCIGINDPLRFARSLRLGPDGSIYGVGDILLGSSPTAPKAGWIFKLSGTGDIIWDKIIIDTMENLTGGLTDLAFDSSGGLYACGTVYEITPEATFSRLWLLHLSSDGCFNSFCGDTIYVPDVSSSTHFLEKPLLALFPNPADNYIILRSENALSFEIRNVCGILCMEGNIQPGEDVIQISKLPVGMFNFITKQQGQPGRTTKLVIVR